MSLNSSLLIKTGKFLNGETTLAELANWVSDREIHWAALPKDSVARFLADTIMLAAYEVSDGVRDPETVKELISEASLQPAHG